MPANTARDSSPPPDHARPPFALDASWRRWLQPRRLAIVLIVLLTLAPVCYVFLRTAEARRNIVYWDEFDTALAFVLRLKNGAAPGQVLQDLFAVSNEHRMVTSRLLFATSYWVTGTVNFSFVSLVGNGTIVALALLLVLTAGTTERRLLMGGLLAFLLFQLEHYENFLWSGASIDHFQVVLLAGAALIAVARGSDRAVILGGVFATLATFTLAHGIVVWPVGAGLLIVNRKYRGLVPWCGIGAVAIGGFLLGFQLNRSQSFATLSVEGVIAVIRYWLAMAGALPALGSKALAPFLGAVLLALLGFLAWRGAARREPIAFTLAIYAVGAMALIAVGRAAESQGEVFSRYYVLSGTAWALALFILLERATQPRRPLLPVVAALPFLIAFNVTANQRFSAPTDSWLECRDRAVLRFHQYGEDGHGPFKLYPVPARSTALLKDAERLGVYRLGSLCLPRSFPKAKPSNRITYFIDEMTVNSRSAYVAGWAAIKGVASKRGRVHLVLHNGHKMHVFTALTITRPDVVEGTKEPAWKLAGFRFARERDRLPTGDFQVGLLIELDGHEEYVLTAHRLQLVGEGQAVLATSR